MLLRDVPMAAKGMLKTRIAKPGTINPNTVQADMSTTMAAQKEKLRAPCATHGPTMCDTGELRQCYERCSPQYTYCCQTSQTTRIVDDFGVIMQVSLLF